MFAAVEPYKFEKYNYWVNRSPFTVYQNCNHPCPIRIISELPGSDHLHMPASATSWTSIRWLESFSVHWVRWLHNSKQYEASPVRERSLTCNLEIFVMCQSPTAYPLPIHGRTFPRIDLFHGSSSWSWSSLRGRVFLVSIVVYISYEERLMAFVSRGTRITNRNRVSYLRGAFAIDSV
jgi:hypothetical protein